VNNEDFTSAGVTGTATLSTAASNTTNAGTATITTAAGTLAAPNYVFNTLVNGTLTINQAPLTVTGLTGTARTYNGSVVDALSGGTLSGLANNETLTLGGITSGTLASPNAGSEAVSTTVTIADGTGLASNYTLTQPTLANVNIAQAPLTVTGLNSAMSAGNWNPTFGVIYQGFVNSESATSLTTPPTVSTTATVSSVAGNYPVTVSGAVDPNYAFTYVNGSLTVSPAFQPAIADNAVENALPGLHEPPLQQNAALTANSILAELTHIPGMTGNSDNQDVLSPTEFSNRNGRSLLSVVGSGIKLPDGM